MPISESVLLTVVKPTVECWVSASRKKNAKSPLPTDAKTDTAPFPTGTEKYFKKLEQNTTGDETFDPATGS
jgi:hypothetical protein